MGEVTDRLERKLRAAFQPELLRVIDQTNEHHGHAGWRESGETHFRVEITAAAFAGKSRVERQRQIYAVLAEDMNNPVHALSLLVKAPGEIS
jgi:BolA protein